LGGLIGVSAGTAYALKLDHSEAISICCIGDAGTEQGVFWETLNFASLHELPLLLICENNGMSVDAKIDERQIGEIKDKVSSFKVSTFDSVTEAVDYVRKIRKPAFCEVKVKLECSHINMATMLD
jgi:pyruvate dehydrogenase E1 component alpha subunit